MIDKFLTYLRAEKRYSDHTVEAYERDVGQFVEFLGLRASAGGSLTAQTEEPSESDGRQVMDEQGGMAARPIFDPAAVTTDDIREWIQDMSKRRLSSMSVNRKTSSLRAFYRYLRKTGRVGNDPFMGVGFRKKPSMLPGFVPESKMDDILDDLDALSSSDDFSTRRNALLILLFYSTGVRVSELRGIRIGDFSNGYSELRVRGKGGKERVVPVVDYTRRKVEEYLGRFSESNICTSQDLSLFLSERSFERKAPLSRSQIYKIVRDFLAGEGVQGKRSPHVLRHTFATHMMDGGADIKEIQEILGHNSLAATQVYTHNSIAKLKEVYAKAHPRGRVIEKEEKE